MSAKAYVTRVRGDTSGLIVRSWSCSSCGRFDDSVPRDQPHEARPCPRCAAAAEPALSAPLMHVPWATFVRGKSDAPPSPLATDTRAIADGQSVEDWKAGRRKVWADHDRAEMKAEGLL